MSPEKEPTEELAASQPAVDGASEPEALLSRVLKKIETTADTEVQNML